MAPERPDPPDPCSDLCRLTDPRREDDAGRRLEAVRALVRRTVHRATSAEGRHVARHVALALEDPDARVREAAAQGLGEMHVPAALIYVMPYAEHLRLDSKDRTAQQREEALGEYRAALRALRVLGHNREHAAASLKEAALDRDALLAWYDSEAAVPQRLRALDDLERTPNVGPRWALRYTLSDLWRTELPDGRATPAAVYLRTYRLLRARVRAVQRDEPKRFAGDAWWPSFPMVEEDLTADDIPRLRSALRGWWRSLTKGRSRGG